MARPRVLFINHTSKIAGAELVLLDLVRPWNDGSAFLFEDGPLADELRERGLAVIRSRWGGGLAKVRRDESLWAAAPLLGKLGGIASEIALAARSHDLLYANSQKAFVLSALATAVARRPLIWHLHDIIDASHFAPAQRRLQVALANRLASRIIVPSAAAAAAFVGAGGRRDRLEVVPNGVDLVPDAKPPEALRQELGLPTGRLAGVFSRLAPWKGQHVVLDALRKVPDLHCIIAGDALFGEEGYARRLKDMVDAAQLGDRVHFLGHRNDVGRLMQACDVVIHPSVDPEPFGRTLVEAMLAGVPLIATDTGAASDILEGGKAGTLVKPNDAGGLAAAITAVLARPGPLSGQLAHAQQRARAHYSVERMREAVCGIIGQVMTGRTAVGARA
jgi:glycosyltransferase involved in cell wall biosynthesis